jgi:hypothetical protein
VFLCFLSTWRTFLHMYTVYNCPFGPQYNLVGHSLTWYQRARFSHLQTNPASVHRAASAPSRDLAPAACSRVSSRAGRRPLARLASPRAGRHPRARASLLGLSSSRLRSSHSAALAFPRRRLGGGSRASRLPRRSCRVVTSFRSHECRPAPSRELPLPARFLP